MPTTQRRPHAVLIAMYYPPSRASGVYRALAMANHLASQDWDVTVLTVPESFFDRITGSRDDSLLQAVDPRVDVRRVPFSTAHLEADVRWMGNFRGTFPHVHRVVTRAHQRWLFPEQYSTWIPPVVAAGRRLHQERPVDVLIATGNPWSAFAAAWGLSRTLRVPYVMDYRDSWTLDIFAEEDAYPPGHLARRWERRLIRGAARSIFVNNALRDWHAQRYPEAAERMLVIPNGWDAGFLAEPTFRAPDPEAFRFGYVGTVTDKLPHGAMWGGWELAKERGELDGATAHVFGHLGFFPHARERVRSLLPLARADVHYEGPLEKGDVAGTYGSLDALLLMAADSRYVTSGKVFECMAAGKPLVGVHSPTTAIAEPLRGYPLYFPAAELSVVGVADALVAAKSAARRVTAADMALCLAHARRYRRDVLLAPFESELREVVRARS